MKERQYPLYCADNGRPAVNPAVLFKMLFICHLHGIQPERQLVREIEVNVAYRWFSGLGPGDTCRAAGVPITNYGLAIAFSLGIFERAMRRAWEKI